MAEKVKQELLLTPYQIKVSIANWEMDLYYGKTKDTSSVMYTLKAQLAKAEPLIRKDEKGRIITEVKYRIDHGYHDRDDYPPYELMSWDDRNRYREYIFRILDEVLKEEA